MVMVVEGVFGFWRRRTDLLAVLEVELEDLLLGTFYAVAQENLFSLLLALKTCFLRSSLLVLMLLRASEVGVDCHWIFPLLHSMLRNLFYQAFH